MGPLDPEERGLVPSLRPRPPRPVGTNARGPKWGGVLPFLEPWPKPTHVLGRPVGRGGRPTVGEPGWWMRRPVSEDGPGKEPAGGDVHPSLPATYPKPRIGANGHPGETGFDVDPSSVIDYRDYPILLVDDEAENLQAFRLNFRDTFTIDTCDSGEAALRLLRERPYAILISDQRMPNMTGIELLQRTVREHPHLIRLILTGYTDQESLIQAINQGRIYHYITKPWNRDELVITLKRAVEAWALAARNRDLVQDLKGQMAEMGQVVEERTRALREAAERLRRLAISDGLSGLYNHRYFQERWRREVARARRFGECVSLMVLDVDKFKNFNDTMGHPAGDALLREIAELLTRSVREIDLVARYGGEEFVVVLPKARKEDAMVLADRIRARIGDHPFPHREVQPNGRVTVSVGVGTFPDDGGDAGEVIVRTDQALYAAKRTGRDRVIAAGTIGDANPLPEDHHDMDLVVDEDGLPRPVIPAATDVPMASALEAGALRAFQERRQASLDFTDPGSPGPLRQAAEQAVAQLLVQRAVAEPAPPMEALSAFDRQVGGGTPDEEEEFTIEIDAISDRYPAIVRPLPIPEPPRDLIATGDLLMDPGGEEPPVPPRAALEFEDLCVEVDESGTVG